MSNLKLKKVNAQKFEALNSKRIGEEVIFASDINPTNKTKVLRADNMAIKYVDYRKQGVLIYEYDRFLDIESEIFLNTAEFELVSLVPWEHNKKA